MRSVSRVFQKRWLLPLLLISLLGLFAFGPALHGWYFGDDFQYWTHKIASNPWWFFSHKNPLHVYAYRPIEFAVLWVFQTISPESTLPIHATQLALHLAIGGLVIHLVRTTGSSIGVAWLAGAVFVLSQAAVHAVCSLDTLSQLLETLLGLLAIHFLHRWTLSPSRHFLVAGSFLCYGLALFSKELSLSLSVSLAVYLGIRVLQRRVAILQAILAMIPHALISVAYLAIRRSLHLPSGGFGDGMYDFNLQHNLVVNPLLALVQSAMPMASSDVFLWTKLHWIPGLLAAGSLTTGALFLPLIGYWKSRHWRLPAYLAIGFLTTICIAFLMNHISELYVYSVLPFFGWYFAQGIAHLWREAPHRMARTALALFVGVFLVANAVSSHRKSMQVEENGRYARSMMNQLEQIIRSAPPQANIVLQETSGSPSYSIYIQRDFMRISYGPSVLCHLLRRSDLRFEFRPHQQMEATVPQGTLAYQIESDSMVAPFLNRSEFVAKQETALRTASRTTLGSDNTMTASR